MTERLSSADVAFFYLEKRSTPQHVGGLAVFDPPPGGFDYDRLVRLLEERISLVPRYRQKTRAVPGNLANPVWIDDPAFDITYHVRRSALPHPGGDAELLEFCARIQSRLLDRSRPLWEMYLVEGLSGGRVAVITKTHHSMVDGAAAIDIAQVLLDASPEPRRTVGVLWMPEPEPSDMQLIGDALLVVALRPAALADAVWLSTGGARSKAALLTGAASAVGAVVAGALRRSRPSPLRAGPGQHRRIAIARTRLEDFRRVRQGLGGTVNDAMLATVAGALRSWLLSRGESVRALTMVRALVPISVAGDGDVLGDNGESASRVTGLLVDLPVGEPDPAARLFHVQRSMAAHTHAGAPGAGTPVSADVLVSLSGFAPPTLHALGARAANGLTRLAYSLVVTNVPGPQLPLYAAGARMTEMFPILPLNKGEAISVALTSYDGGVFFGINGDRDAVPDIAALASFVVAALAELVEAASGGLDPASEGLDPASGGVDPAGYRATGRVSHKEWRS